MNEPIVEYAVIHELAHLKERNHSEQFWRIVEEQDPSCHEHARWLKEQAAFLEFDRLELNDLYPAYWNCFRFPKRPRAACMMGPSTGDPIPRFHDTRRN